MRAIHGGEFIARGTHAGARSTTASMTPASSRDACTPQGTSAWLCVLPRCGQPHTPALPLPSIHQPNHPLPEALPGLPTPYTFLCAEVEAMRAVGAIKRVSHRPYIVQPISVATNSAGTKLRLIYDWRVVKTGYKCRRPCGTITCLSLCDGRKRVLSRSWPAQTQSPSATGCWHRKG